MQIRERDIKILMKVNECRWLATSQLKRYFFSNATTRAVSKRLNLLVKAGFLNCNRQSYVDEYYYQLGTKCRQLLLDNTEISAENLVIPRSFPKQLNHLSKINDIRWYVENSLKEVNGELHFFLVDRDLKGLLRNSLVIPDILLSFKFDSSGKALSFKGAVEYDSGTENPQYFGRDKIKKYYEMISSERQIFNTPGLQVLVIADSRRRIAQLIKYSFKFLNSNLKVLFCAMEDIQVSKNLFNVAFIDPQLIKGATANYMCTLFD